MDKLGDIELFVSVVKKKGLAAAGRRLGMSPASVTAKLNRLEKSYGVRLLTRTTRQISLTEEGATFYQHCLKILNEVHQADESLKNLGESLQGHLKMTATVDFGKQAIAPVILARNMLILKAIPPDLCGMSGKGSDANLILRNSLMVRCGMKPKSSGTGRSTS